MFGLTGAETDTLYEQLRFEIRPGQIVAVVGPSGAGKSVLLREVARQFRQSRWLKPGALARSEQPAVTALRGGSLAQRLAILSRCGLADAAALITPARCLSGGQRYRLALAQALHCAMLRGRPALVIADEFAAGLDPTTAAVLCRQMRKLVTPSALGLLLATPRPDLTGLLQPDLVIAKPLGGPPRILEDSATTPDESGGIDPARWRIVRGTIADYGALARFHYLSGPPAAHKRVYVIRPPRRLLAGPLRRIVAADPAAVLVVSPPVPSVRGRNLATAGRYAGPDRAAAMELLNREIECISRVIVHPTFRGCGLAVRLVRRALATAETPMVEALAAMGRVHPFFERAGMTAYHLPPDEHIARLISAAEAVGIVEQDLASVGPVKRLLARPESRAAAFLRRELDRCAARTIERQPRRPADAVAETCRRTARRYVYYLAARTKE